MTKQGSILVIDDEESMRIAISQWLKLSDYSVTTYKKGAQALSDLSSEFKGVVITDIRMPEMDGLELMEKVLAIDPEIPVVLITAHGDVPMSVQAMKNGAYDFIEKPFEPEILMETVKRAQENRDLILENRELRKKLHQSTGLENQLLGNSDVIQLLHQEIRDFGPTDASIFLVGETGSGKEVVARCIHEISARSDSNFVAINCGAIPETLFESELFGHEAGAFTGANKRRIGKFEAANGGTLFLDEVNSMPLNLQVKVLRVLQEREIERLGGNNPIPIDIRVISATNTDPRKACDAGNFREDLYYRLNVAEIHIPPLRVRGRDIILLFEYYCLKAAEKYNREVIPPDSSSITALLSHNWPGNVRELKNCAERYVLSSLPANHRIKHIICHQDQLEQDKKLSLSEQVENFEKCILQQSLKKNKGSIAQTLEELRLPRRTLNQKMKNYHISRKDFIDEEE